MTDLLTYLAVMFFSAGIGFLGGYLVGHVEGVHFALKRMGTSMRYQRHRFKDDY